MDAMEREVAKVVRTGCRSIEESISTRCRSLAVQYFIGQRRGISYPIRRKSHVRLLASSSSTCVEDLDLRFSGIRVVARL